MNDAIRSRDEPAGDLGVEGSADETAAVLAIQRNMLGYARAADRGRPDDLAARFHPDGTLRIVGDTFDAGEYAGRDAIAARIGRTVAELGRRSHSPRVRHHISTMLVELRGPGRAVASSYFLALTGDGPDHWGRYRDQLSRRDGVWRFDERTVIHEGFRPGGWIDTELALRREGGAR